MESLPPCEAPSDITVISDPSDIENGIRLLLNGKLPNEITQEDNVILGFDCEWPGLRKYLLKEDPLISLIELSNGEKTVLFRINLTGLDGNDYLSQLLTSKTIIKSGHKIGTDANRLKEEYGVDMDNIFDFKFTSLARRSSSKSYPHLVAIFLKKHLTKKTSCTISNWGTNGPLSKTQVEIAAIKAHANYQLYHIFKETKADIDCLPDDSDTQLQSLFFNYNKKRLY